jgi:dipeptidyl aminopeptidase/acylaminoacyl peptidase
MRRVFLLMSALCVALPSFAQTKHPFTFEDMMALKRVEEPVPSPDGKWALFAAVDVDLKANTKTPHVWIVPLQAKAGSSATQDETPSATHPAPVGMTGSGEREIISDQDADRPRWAPDGKRFAFVSTKEGGSQIWIADFDGATGTVIATHRLTKFATEASGELWSPDGKNILFTSDVYPECTGGPQQESECNARNLEDAKNSKVKALIFTRLMYRHWNAYKEGKRTHIFVLRAPSLDFRWPGRPSAHEPKDTLSSPTGLISGEEVNELFNSVYPRDLTPGDYDAPPFSLGGQDDYAFSPDGQEICFSSNHDPVEAISTNKDLFTVPVNFPADASSAQVLAATKNITADNKAADETPLYSPDGKYIAYRAQARPGYESDRWRLMLYDRKTGKTLNLTDSLDRWVGSFTWGGFGHELFFTAEGAGQSAAYTIAPEICREHCHPIKLIDGYNDDIAAVGTKTVTDRRGTTVYSDVVVFSRMSVQAPSQIFIAEHGSCSVGLEKEKAMMIGESNEPLPPCAMVEAGQVTHLNDSVLSQVAMSPLESFWFPGANNDKVEGFLVKPPNFDPNKKYPVKFLIHGGPEGAWGDDWSYRWNPELFAANGYVVIMINFHGSTGYGQKFIDAINGDWGGAPFEDLMKGLDYAEQHYPFIDKTRECALGASYGGYMADWILGHTDRFKCIVTHDGLFNTESAYGATEELWFNEWEFKGTPWTNREMYRKWSPHLSAAHFKTPTLVIHSQLDYRLDVSQGLDLFTTLQRQGVPSKMLYFPDEGHWVLKPQNSQLWYKTVNEWVDQWVGK